MMSNNTVGIVRKVDVLGRIVIPKEMRKILNIEPGDAIQMYIFESNALIVKKHMYMLEVKNVIRAALKKYLKTTGATYLVVESKLIVDGSKKHRNLIGKEVNSKFVEGDYEHLDIGSGVVFDEKVKVVNIIKFDVVRAQILLINHETKYVVSFRLSIDL